MKNAQHSSKTTFDLVQWVDRMKQRKAIGRAIAMDSGNWHHKNNVPVITAQKMPKTKHWKDIDNEFERQMETFGDVDVYRWS